MPLADAIWPRLIELVEPFHPQVAGPAVRDAIAWVDGILSAPGPWRAFSPNDCCPDNNRLMPDGRLRMFDLEFSGCRHAMLDLAYVRTVMPTCWCLRLLPAELADALVERYRSRLFTARPELSTEEFEVGLAAARAYWAVFPLDWFLGRALHGPDAGRRRDVARTDFEMPSPREICRLRLDDLATVAAERAEVAPLGALAEALLARLGPAWGARGSRGGRGGSLPVYPAFAAERGGGSTVRSRRTSANRRARS